MVDSLSNVWHLCLKENKKKLLAINQDKIQHMLESTSVLESHSLSLSFSHHPHSNPNNTTGHQKQFTTVWDEVVNIMAIDVYKQQAVMSDYYFLSMHIFLIIHTIIIKINLKLKKTKFLRCKHYFSGPPCVLLQVLTMCCFMHDVIL